LHKGIRYILLSTVFFAFVNIGVKALSNPNYFGLSLIPAHEIVWFRSLVTFIISYVLLKRKGLSILGTNRKWLLIRGIFGTLALTFFFITIQHSELAIATVLQYLSPIFTLLLAQYLFGMRINNKQWLMIGIALLGVLTISYHKLRGSNIELIWLVLGLLSAICSGVAYNAILKCKETDSALNVVIYFPMIAIPIMSVALLFDYVLPTFQELMVLLAIGVLTQFAQVYMTKALQTGHYAEIAPFKYLGAIYAVVLGYTVFDEKVHLVAGIGMLAILLGVIGSQILNEKEQLQRWKQLPGRLLNVRKARKN
jgi:drug/metabolite transporter (DMT)-like permease